MVFVICGTYAIVLLSYEVYIGNNAMDGSTTFGDMTDSINEAGLTSCFGQTLYPDNCYTLVTLATNLFDSHGYHWKECSKWRWCSFQQVIKWCLQQWTQD